MENIPVRSLRSLVAFVLVAFALAVPATAWADLITLKLPNIPGDLTGVPGQEATIEVLSLSGNVQATGTGGTPVFADIIIHKRFDGSSPALFQALTLGRRLDTGVITFLRKTTAIGAGYTRYFTITLRNVLLTKFQTDASENQVVAGQEQINLNYSRITLRDEISGYSACFDITTRSSC